MVVGEADGVRAAMGAGAVAGEAIGVRAAAGAGALAAETARGPNMVETQGRRGRRGPGVTSGDIRKWLAQAIPTRQGTGREARVSRHPEEVVEV